MCVTLVREMHVLHEWRLHVLSRRGASWNRHHRLQDKRITDNNQRLPSAMHSTSNAPEWDKDTEHKHIPSGTAAELLPAPGLPRTAAVRPGEVGPEEERRLAAEEAAAVAAVVAPAAVLAAVAGVSQAVG